MWQVAITVGTLRPLLIATPGPPNCARRSGTRSSLGRSKAHPSYIRKKSCGFCYGSMRLTVSFWRKQEPRASSQQPEKSRMASTVSVMLATASLPYKAKGHGSYIWTGTDESYTSTIRNPMCYPMLNGDGRSCKALEPERLSEDCV